MKSYEHLLPPDPYAGLDRRIIERSANKTLEEIRAGLIRAGIMTEDGKLAPHYRKTGRKRKRRQAPKRNRKKSR